MNMMKKKRLGLVYVNGEVQVLAQKKTTITHKCISMI